MATHFSILAWKIPWMEKPGRLQPIGWQRVRLNLKTKQQQQMLKILGHFLLLHQVLTGAHIQIFHDLKTDFRHALYHQDCFCDSFNV